MFQPKTAGTASTHSSNAGNGNTNNPLVGASGGAADQSTRDGNEPMTTSERRLSRPHIDAGEYWPSPTLLRIRRRRSPLHQFAESLLERTRLASASNTTAILGGMPFFSILQLNLRKVKLEKILKGSLDSIPSPSSSVKIQIMGQ